MRTAQCWVTAKKNIQLKTFSAKIIEFNVIIPVRSSMICHSFKKNTNKTQSDTKNINRDTLTLG